jgi:hypothetical protein
VLACTLDCSPWQNWGPQVVPAGSLSTQVSYEGAVYLCRQGLLWPDLAGDVW